MQKAVEKSAAFFCVYAKRNGLNPTFLHSDQRPGKSAGQITEPRLEQLTFGAIVPLNWVLNDQSALSHYTFCLHCSRFVRIPQLCSASRS
jgi:hypothetical protein